MTGHSSPSGEELFHCLKLGELDIRIFLDLKQESHESLPVNTRQKYLKAKGNIGCCKPYCLKGGQGRGVSPLFPFAFMISTINSLAMAL